MSCPVSRLSGLKASSAARLLRSGSLFLVFALAPFFVAPMARALDPPPDGGYPGGNTAEGENAGIPIQDVREPDLPPIVIEAAPDHHGAYERGERHRAGAHQHDDSGDGRLAGSARVRTIAILPATATRRQVGQGWWRAAEIGLGQRPGHVSSIHHGLPNAC